MTTELERVQAIFDAADVRCHEEGTGSLTDEEEQDIFTLVEDLVRQRDTYRATCKNAQERGTVKHEQVVRARGLLRRALPKLKAVKFPGVEQDYSLEDLPEDIEAELARSID